MLVVSHSLAGGGAERFASILLTHLDRGRFAPAACLARKRRVYAVPADVPVSGLGYRGLVSLPFSLLRLRWLISRRRPDVVLSNVLSTNCLAGGALRGLAEPPAWIARVGLAPERGDPWLQRFWARRVYPAARAVVTNSERMLESVERRYPGIRGLSIPNPTDFERLDRLAAEPPLRRAVPGTATLVAVGRLSAQKRPDVLLRALAEIRRGIDARLWICGDGPLRQQTGQWISELGLGGAVEVLGFCDNPFALLDQADLFVSSSDYEGLPNALIEAQGLGVPAVATRCPYGPDEIVEDGVTGRLVATGDPEALAAAALEILRHPARRARMAERAAELTRRRFGLAQVLPRWQDLIAEAAGSR